MAPKYKLSYFDISGKAEPIRFLFHYGGIKFEDVRFERSAWPTLKEKMPFGQVPVLEVDGGKKINQSIAIARYVAKLVKLAGKDDLHALEIDAMVDNLSDVYQKIFAYMFEPNEVEKEKKRVVLVNESLPSMLGKLDAIAKENKGYFVRGELSWADVVFASTADFISVRMNYNVLEKFPSLQKVVDNVLAIPNIKTYLATRPKNAF